MSSLALCFFLVDTPDDTIMVDVTVCSTKAKSWAGYSASEIKERVEIAKKRAYGRFVSKDEEAQVRLVTFFIDVWGSMSDNSWNLLRALAEANPEGPTAAKMAQKISALTVVWSGRCAHAAGLLRVWGANTGLSSFCTQGRGPNTAQTRNASSYKQDDNQDAEAGDDPSGAAALPAQQVKYETDEQRKCRLLKTMFPNVCGSFKKGVKGDFEDERRSPGPGQAYVHSSVLLGAASPSVSALFSASSSNKAWVDRRNFGVPSGAESAKVSASGTLGFPSRSQATSRGE